MTSAHVVVLGSANCDLVLSVDRLPAAGETLLARGIRREPGGKGANQAVAAAHAGATTAMLGAVGRDREADLLRVTLAAAGVDTSRLRSVEEPSGFAVVTVDRAGANSIVVAAGANGRFGPLTDEERGCIADARVLLCQLEVPVSTVVDGARTARTHGTTVVLNAAPSQRLPPEIWDLLDVLIVNEHEAADLGDALAQAPVVVITRGAKGARLVTRQGVEHEVPAPAVTAVDTTGAGDVFCGAFAATLAARNSLTEAMKRAVAAASLSVQRHGAMGMVP